MYVITSSNFIVDVVLVVSKNSPWPADPVAVLTEDQGENVSFAMFKYQEIATILSIASYQIIE